MYVDGDLLGCVPVHCYIIMMCSVSYGNNIYMHCGKKHKKI